MKTPRRALRELLLSAQNVQEQALLEDIDACGGDPAHRFRLSPALEEVSRLIDTHPAEA